MKSRIFILISTITVFAVLGNRIRVAAQDHQEQKAAQPHRYTVINLGTLGGIEAAGFGINNRGWVTGDADLHGSQTEHAFLWRNGVKVDLGTFGGPNSSAPGFPSDKGVIVGSAQTPEEDPFGEFFLYYGCPVMNTYNTCLGVNPDKISLPFRWQDGVMTPLFTLGGNQGQAVSVNNLGQVVGYAENSTHDTSCVPLFLYIAVVCIAVVSSNIAWAQTPSSVSIISGSGEVAANTFTSTGSMLHAREDHTATLLNDGKVPVVGGMYWAERVCTIHGCGPRLFVLASAELYDPATRKFARTGSMSVPRVFHTATLLREWQGPSRRWGQ